MKTIKEMQDSGYEGYLELKQLVQNLPAKELNWVAKKLEIWCEYKDRYSARAEETLKELNISVHHYLVIQNQRAKARRLEMAADTEAYKVTCLKEVEARMLESVTIDNQIVKIKELMNIKRKPSKLFFKFWRKDKKEVKDQGLFLLRNDDGWYVSDKAYRPEEEEGLF